MTGAAIISMEMEKWENNQCHLIHTRSATPSAPPRKLLAKAMLELRA
jgi:hypothetical protein